MISRRRLMFAPFAVLVAPLVRQNEEHQTLPPPTVEMLHERVIKLETMTWVHSFLLKQQAFEDKRIWQHLIPTGWWRPRLKRPT
jgi:hypothetical protein